MAGLCEGGNEPLGSLKAISKRMPHQLTALSMFRVGNPARPRSIPSACGLLTIGKFYGMIMEWRSDEIMMLMQNAEKRKNPEKSPQLRSCPPQASL
ncbi:hypothetical protein ANN_06659 [Periplaneta americana]|uniref:Uncharacterized protein n=1 Tax=Periplaneta americana TaxID=6978 RepID=A0ABQ8TG08_PERAM|nr:hypothetical protein ANN_06659 [Periplaneta americana]